MLPHIKANRICYPTHNIVLDPILCAAMPDYIFDMEEALTPDGGPSEHRQELNNMNNDGSWTIEGPKVELRNFWDSESAERRGALPTRILAIVTLFNGAYDHTVFVTHCERSESFQPLWRAIREAKFYFGQKAKRAAETEYFKKYNEAVAAHAAATYEDPACFI